MVSLNADALPQTFEFKFVGLDDEEDVTPLWENGENRKVTLPPMEQGEVVVYELQQADFPIYPWKGAGTVIPVFSLRSEGSFGVGDFGDLKHRRPETDGRLVCQDKAARVAGAAHQRYKHDEDLAGLLSL